MSDRRGQHRRMARREGRQGTAARIEDVEERALASERDEVADRGRRVPGDSHVEADPAPETVGEHRDRPVAASVAWRLALEHLADAPVDLGAVALVHEDVSEELG